MRSGAPRGIWENTSARGLSECPLQFPRLSPSVHSAQFPGLPPQIPPRIRVSKGNERSVLLPPLIKSPYPELLSHNQLILYVDVRLSQQLGHRVTLQSRGVEKHPHRPLFLVELDALDSVDLAHTVNGPQLSLSGRSLVAVDDFKVRHSRDLLLN